MVLSLIEKDPTDSSGVKKKENLYQLNSLFIGRTLQKSSASVMTVIPAHLSVLLPRNHGASSSSKGSKNKGNNTSDMSSGVSLLEKLK